MSDIIVTVVQKGNRFAALRNDDGKLGLFEGSFDLSQSFGGAACGVVLEQAGLKVIPVAPLQTRDNKHYYLCEHTGADTEDMPRRVELLTADEFLASIEVPKHVEEYLVRASKLELT